MDDSLIRSELSKCERKLRDITEKYERESSKLEAEIRVYRNLLRIADGTKPKFSEWLERFLKDSKLRKSDLAGLVGVSDTTIDNWLKGMAPAKRLAGEIGRKLCDLSGNTIGYDDMMEMINNGKND